MCKGAYSAFLGRQHTRIAHTVQKEKKKGQLPPTASTPPPLKKFTFVCKTSGIHWEGV